MGSISDRKAHLINRVDFSLVNNDDADKIAEHRAGLRKNNLNDVIRHSSDAHDMTRLGVTKLWIKADPTFAELKQAINGGDRIFLGTDAPRYKADHEVIDGITVPSSNGWFASGFSN